MRLLFLSHGPLSSNSGLHISALAPALASHGWQSRALVPSFDDTSSTPSDSLPTGLYSQCADLLRSWHPDLVHLWTPRQRIVSLWRQIQQRCPDAVGCLHLEDSEEILTRRSLGWSQADWQTPPQGVSVPAGLTDPQAFRQLLTEIPGVSGLVPTLLEGVPSSVPTCCFAPGFEEGMEWEVAAETSYDSSWVWKTQSRWWSTVGTDIQQTEKNCEVSIWGLPWPRKLAVKYACSGQERITSV